MTIYNYTIDSIFNNITPNIVQLRKEIENVFVLVGISQQDNNVVIELDDVVDISVLEKILMTHIPDFSPPKINFFTYIPRSNVLEKISYPLIGIQGYQRLKGQFKYAGMENVGTINYIEVLAWQDKDIESYGLRIYDTINDTVLAERDGLTNTEESFIDLGAISNVSTGAAVLELHVKHTGGSDASQIYIDQIVVYINN